MTKIIQTINQLYKSIYYKYKMQQVQNIDYMDRLSIILKLIKYREDNYFKLTDFIKRNIDGMKNQTQQVSIVNLFLKKIQERESEIIQEEEVLINQYKGIIIKSSKYPKKLFRFIFRLSARIFETFQGSLLRIKGTLFYDPKVEMNFREFQYKVSQYISESQISLKQLILGILDYSKSKYRNQLKKINKFLQRLEDGQRIKLKQFYQNYNEQQEAHREKIINEDTAQEELYKKPKHSKESKKSKQKYKDRKQSTQKSPQKPQIKKQNKTNIVNKMMKLYSVIDPSRLQFVQDFIYEYQSIHQQKTTNSLLQKNKQISEQINQYYLKTQSMTETIDNLKIKQPKSDYEMQIQIMQNQFHKSKCNFVISKERKLIKNSFFKKLKGYNESSVENSQLFSNSTVGQYSSGNQYLSDTLGTLIVKTQRKSQKKPNSRPNGSKMLIKTKVFPNLTIPERSDLFINFDEQTIGRNTLTSNKNSRIGQRLSNLIQDQNGKDKLFLMNLERINNNNTNYKFFEKNKKQSYSKKITISAPVTNRIIVKRQQENESNLNKQLIITNFNNRGLEQKSGVSQRKQLYGNLNTIVISTNNKKEYNLRLKKQKKNIFINEKLFIQQINQQINNFNRLQ